MKLCVLWIMCAMFLKGTISYQSNFARIWCQLLYYVFYLCTCMMVLGLLLNSSTRTSKGETSTTFVKNYYVLYSTKKHLSA